MARLRKRKEMRKEQKTQEGRRGDTVGVERLQKHMIKTSENPVCVVAGPRAA